MKTRKPTKWSVLIPAVLVLGVSSLVPGASASNGRDDPARLGSAADPPYTVYLPFVVNGQQDNVTVSPARGGTLLSSDGLLQLEVPEGAVRSNVTIWYRRLDCDAPSGYESTGFASNSWLKTRKAGPLPTSGTT